MNNSTKRVIRTVYQILVALVTFIPVVIVYLPVELSSTALVVALAGWTAVVATIINSLEDAGVLPAWLKDESSPE